MARESALELIDELLRLEEESHPCNGIVAGKDEKSRLALMEVERLVEMLAGWAIDHQIGLVVNGLPGGAAFPANGKQTDTQRQADDHRHEDAASEYEFADPKINRRILAAMLEHGPGPFPIPIVIEATEALISLDRGETQPFVRPVRGVGKEGQAHTKWMLRYWAVLHVDFFRGMNLKRLDVLAKVADAYGVEPETLDGWVADAPKQLKGIRPVREMKGYARGAGRNAYLLMVTGQSSDRDKRTLKRISAHWGESALKHHGSEYRQVSRDTEGSVVPLSP